MNAKKQINQGDVQKQSGLGLFQNRECVSLYIVSEIENNEKINVYSIMNMRKVQRRA